MHANVTTMSATDKPIVSVVGPGRMGTGIAQALAVGDYPVQLVDVKARPAEDSRQSLAAARQQVEAGLSLLASIGFLDDASRDRALGLVSYCDDSEADDALSRSHAVFEAVPEILDAKRSTFARIGDVVPATALVASTTSTFGVVELSALLHGPTRFMNTHWLNPPTLIPLVEVAASAATSDDSVAAMLQLLRDAGKVPVRCASSPGFIVPRIQAVAMNEAARMVEEGVADPDTIDAACRLGFGIRFATMGLVEFIDWGGVDTLLHASTYLQNALGSDRYGPPEIVTRKVESGALGLKTGRGFRDLDGRDLDEYQRETLQRIVDLLAHLDLLRRPLPPERPTQEHGSDP